MNYINLFILIPALILEIVAIILYRIHATRYKLISNTETSKITTLKKGFYEIKGKIEIIGEKLVSPFAKAECVYYKFKVEEERSSGKSSSWHTIINDEDQVRFGVRDSSGLAIVELEGAKLKLNTDWKGKSGTFNKSTKEMDIALAQYNRSSKGFLGQKRLRYFETVLEEGDELYVLGEVADFEEYYPVFKKSSKPYLVSDRPEESLVRESRIIYQISLFFLIGVPPIALILLAHQAGLL